MRIPALLFFLGLTLSLSAQVTYLYPVKVDHKWGYINKFGHIIVEPTYDAVGDRDLNWLGRNHPSPYRLAEVNRKLGLIDEQCQEVLPPEYGQIRPLSNALFVVQSDTSLIIVNRSGQQSVEGKFESIVLLDTIEGEYCKIKKEGLWGVYQLGTGSILPYKYADIEWQKAGEVFFKVKISDQKERWGLVDTNNKTILPFKYSDIEVINPNFFITMDDYQNWMIRDRSGKQIVPGNWMDIEQLNPHFVRLKSGINQRVLFSCLKQDTITLSYDYDGFAPFNDQWIICRSRTNLGLLDASGNEVIAPSYLRIKPSNDSIVRVMQIGWGFHKIGQGLAIPCQYDSISMFKGRFCKVKKNGLYGLVDVQMRELLPPAFESILILDTLIKAYDSTELQIFSITEEGEVALMNEVSNVRTLRVGFQNTYYNEAKPKKKRTSRVFGSLDTEPSPFTHQKDTTWKWDYEPEVKRWGLKGPSKNIPPAYRNVLYLEQPKLSLVFSPQHSTDAIASDLSLFRVDSFSHFAFFNHQSGEFITPFNMTGLRGKDFKKEFPFAVFLDTKGKMGLINPKGEQVKRPSGEPLRYTYIGEFKNGRARFCKGGKLSIVDDFDEKKRSIDDVRNFVIQFGMNAVNNFGYQSDKDIFIEAEEGETLQWGYIDHYGNVVIPPQFTHAEDFENGNAVNQKKEFWGVIDTSGSTIMDFKYLSIAPFFDKWRVGIKSPTRLLFNPNGYERIIALYQRQGTFVEGRCKVQMDNLWGFIDEEGKEIITCQFEEARDFSEGFAAVKEDGQWSFINKEGQSVIDLSVIDDSVTAAGDFHDGLAWFKTEGHYGFINKMGEVAIAPDFTRVFGFSHGIARAVYNGKTGLIDTAGVWILEPKQFEFIRDFNEWGVAEAREKFKGKKCLINAKGDILTDLIYSSIGNFQEGFAHISDGNLYGLINRKGEEVLPIQFQAIGQVAEGLVHVRKPRQTTWYFVDTLGKKAFEGNFEWVEPFQFGYAMVQVNHFDPDSRFVINKKGKQLFLQKDHQFEFYENGIFGLSDPKGVWEGNNKLKYYYANARGKSLFDRYFEKIKPFKGKAALVRSAYRWGMVNTNGLFVLPPKYPFVSMQETGEAIVNLPIKLGVIDKQGQQVLPLSFDRILLMEGNIFRVELGEKIGYTTIDGEWIWEMKN